MYYQPDSSDAGHLTEDAPRRIKVRRYQPANQSMINRRYMIVPPALLSGGYSEQLGGQAGNCSSGSLKRRT